MTTNYPLISIIVPVYNVEKFISQCIESVIKQTYDNWELILVNDASPDNSAQIIQSYHIQYPDKIKYIVNPVNCGQGVSRNRGVNLATGGWLFFLDSDDLIEPSCLETLLASSDGYDIVLGNSYGLRGNNKFNRDINLISLYEFSKFALGMYAWGTLFDRQFWQQHNFEFKSHKYAEDLLLISKVWCATNRIKVIDTPIYVYRVNENSATHRFYSYDEIYSVLSDLLNFACIDNLGDDFIAFALSNAYNFIKMVASPYSKYKLFMLLKSYIPEYPKNNKFAKDPLINIKKSHKIKQMYLTKGLYFFWRIDTRIFKQIFLKYKKC